jgi:hypothetical protein
MLPAGRQVDLDGVEDVAVNIHQLADGSVAVHLVNYAYDRDRDAVVARPDVQLSVAVPGNPSRATVMTHAGAVSDLPVTADDGRCRLTLPELSLYTIVVFHDGAHRVAASPAAGSPKDI